jgi:superfamily II DNA or RNA helicase
LSISHVLDLKEHFLLGFDETGRPAYGAGAGVGQEFIRHYFPAARQVIRIATAYFTLRGYKLGRAFIADSAQLRILVGRSEEASAYEAVVDEILTELGQCETDLMSTVLDLITRIKSGLFFIREVRSMQVPFHCKIYLIDQQTAWHGSCNYTYRGLVISAEQASASHDTTQVHDLIRWYDGIAVEARDLLQELLQRLENWCQLAEPFDAYLQFLALLDHLPELPKRPGAYAPVFYQRGVIARALRQEQEFGGALIVAATGLGKTIIGAEIAARLQASTAIKRTILIAPRGVQKEWTQQLEGRDVLYQFFTPQVVFLKKSEQASHHVYKLDKALQQADRHTLLLIDEAHFYRNQLLVDESNKRNSVVYERLRPLLAAGAQVVLLTATVYGTSLHNLNSLLRLLPPANNAPDTGPQPWKIGSAAKFSNLPIVTVLGLPHVLRMARERGDVDEQGRTYIQFEHERRYLPQVLKLRTISYQLPLQMELERAVTARCFDQQYKVMQAFFDDEALQTKQGLTDSVYNTTIGGWLSSPAAVLVSLRQNLSSRGADGSRGDSTANGRGKPRTKTFKQALILGADERRQHLAPILANLQLLLPTADAKYQELATIVQRHCRRSGGKVLIFINRHSTALYLQENLQQTFGEALRVGCTVEKVKNMPRLKSSDQRREVLVGFSPKSHDEEGPDRYDVLLCTDADGVGVNLQDCATIVNYDPPGGADVLFQRVGRVLRMTTDSSREVHVYTLVPSIIAAEGNQSRAAQTIRQLFERITQRHEKSKGIMGSSAYATDAQLDTPLAGDVDAAAFVLQDNFLSEIGGLGAKSFLTHNATLERYRSRAEGLADYLLSARTYPEARPRMVVLLKCQGQQHIICYDLKRQLLDDKSDLELLDWLACSETESKAPVDAISVEHAANAAVQHWCQQNKVDLATVSKQSAVYLLPKRAKATAAKQLFAAIQKDLRNADDLPG